MRLLVSFSDPIHMRNRNETMAAGGTSKGGYDYEFVTPPDKSLECPVCLLTLRDPHMISCCGNEFCQRCIERVQRDGKPCPLCNEPNFTTFLNKKLVREVNALVVRCPQKEQGCEWEGELGQLQNHLNLGAGVSPCKGCGFVMVECTYQCGANFQRRLLQDHEMEICPKRPIEMQVASLMRKFETIAVEFKTVSTENRWLRQELEKVQKVHLEELNQVKQELNDVKKKNNHILKANEDMQKMYDEHKAIEKSKFDDLETKYVSLQTHAMPLPVPPFYFSVRNVHQYVTVLSDINHDPIYDSEPFYSHPGGYKMYVSVYPNVSSRYRGAHMAVYVGILCGEFDDHLRWPFNGSITVQAYNRTTEQWSNEHTIVMNRNECGLRYVKRPVDILTHGSWGELEFLSVPELKRDYVKETNRVRLRITKVEICN